MPAKAETILHARHLARLGVPREADEVHPRIGTNGHEYGSDGASEGKCLEWRAEVRCAHDRGQTKTDSGLCGYCGGWNDRSGIVL